MRSKKIYLSLFLVVSVFVASAVSSVANAVLPNNGTWFSHNLINYNGKTFQYQRKSEAGNAIFYPTDEIDPSTRPECRTEAGEVVHPATIELSLPNNGEPGTSATARTYKRGEVSCGVKEEKSVSLTRNDRRNKLFVLNTDTDTITTWNSRDTNIFEKVPRSEFSQGYASKPGWEIYQQGDGGTCRDTIVKNPEGVWYVLPMQDRSDSPSFDDAWAWEYNGSSEFYASLFVNEAGDAHLNSAYYKDCSVGGHKLAYNTGIGDATGYNLGEGTDGNEFKKGKFRHKDICNRDDNNFNEGDVHRIDRSEFDNEIEGWDGHNSEDDSDADKNKESPGSLVDALIFVTDCESKDGAAIVSFVRLNPYKVDSNEDSSVSGIQHSDAIWPGSYALVQIPFTSAAITHQGEDGGVYKIENGVAELTQAEIDATDDATDNNEHTDLGGGDDGGGEGDNTTSCAIEGVGWIVCPAAKFIGELNDALYTVIKQFLEIQPSMFKTGSDTYRVWGQVRNIANVAFVIAFLIIIYSQLTGAGITNYGIKKMLPKLIVAAILVNASFWITALAVDLSNILGSGIYSLLKGAIGGVAGDGGLGSPVNSWSDVMGWVLSGGALAVGGIAAVIAVGTLGFWAALSLLVPGAIVVIMAFITVVVLLIARQAFIILLVAIAPLAFVAYLLPNTDEWFKRWRKFFTTLLIMYPSIALLFGGAELAAAVIRTADPDNALLVIGSLVVTALPLFALPALMKATGGIMNRIGGIVNNPNRGPLDRLKRGAENFRNDRRNFNKGDTLDGTRRWGRRTFRREANREARREAAEARAAAGVAAYQNRTDTRAGAFKRQAIGDQETKSKLDQITANEVKVDHLNLNPNLHTRAIESGLNLHNAEETHKNEATATHVRANPGQYGHLYDSQDQLKVAQQDSKNDYGASGVGRLNAQDIKEAEKRGQNISQEHENDFLGSVPGRQLSRESKRLSDIGKTQESEIESEYLASTVGSDTRRVAVVAQKDATDKGKIVEQEGETIYLQSAGGQAQQAQIIVGNENLGAINANIKADALGTAVGQAAVGGRILGEQRANITTKRAEDAIKATAPFQDLTAEGVVLDESIAASTANAKAQGFASNAGIAATTRRATAEKGASAAVKAAEATFDGDAAYVNAATSAATAEQAAKASESRVDAAVKGDAAYKAAATVAATAEQQAKAASTRADTETKLDSDYIDAATDADAAQQGLSVADSRLESELITENADERVAAQAAKDTTSATQAELDALVAESRTEAGAEKYGIQANPVVGELQAADTAKRVQAQRTAQAGEVATGEYATRISTDDTLAEEAGGINPYGSQRARAAAVQVLDEQLSKIIRDEKTTMESTKGDELMGEYTGFIDGDESVISASPERVAAVAGTIASRGYMGGKLDLLRATGKGMRDAKAKARAKAEAQGIPADQMDEYIKSDSRVKALAYAQKQIAADMKGWPFGAGDTMRDRLALGQWDGNFDEDFGKRIVTKLAPEKLTELKIEEIGDIKVLHDNGTITDEQRASIRNAVAGAVKSPTVSKDVKPETWKALSEMGYDVPSKFLVTES